MPKDVAEIKIVVSRNKIDVKIK